MSVVKKFKGTRNNKFKVIQKLIHKIKNSSIEEKRLNYLRKLEQIQFNTDEVFDYLEQVALTDTNHELRYIATKIIYKNFPEKSRPLIKRLLTNDLNYNFDIINTSKPERYNFNELVNWGIKNMRNREEMVEGIANNDLLDFALSWKEYSNNFKIFYSINLKCFVLHLKNTNIIAYLCRKATDPFQYIPISSIITISKSQIFKKTENKHLWLIINLIIDLLKVNEKYLKFTILSVKTSEEIPNIKVISHKNELILYLNSD